MNAAGGDLIGVTSEDADWPAVRADLRRHGTAVVHGRIADWRPRAPDGPALRAVLGRDWSSYRDIGHPGIRERYAASRRLLKHTAAAALRAEAIDLELAYGPTGRPYLRGCDQIDISLSHTDDLLLVGLTTRGLIGVDAERADRGLYARGLARLMCTPHESRMLTRLPEPERNPSLVRLWTLKEAYSKAIGQGMHLRFNEFGLNEVGYNEFGLNEDGFNEDGFNEVGFNEVGYNEFGLGPESRPVRLNRPDGTPGAGDEWVLRTVALDSGGIAFVVSVAVYDTGLGRTLDTEVTTMLDAEAAAVIEAALDAGREDRSQILDD